MSTLTRAAELSLQEEVSVQRSVVTFDQLLPNLPTDLRDSLALYQLGPSPYFGRVSVLTAQQLQRAWLEALGPEQAAIWPLHTPPSLTVSRVGGLPSDGRLWSLSRNKLHEFLVSRCERLEILPMTILDNELLPEGFILTARVGNGGHIDSRMSVRVEVSEASGKLYRNFTVWARVNCYRQVMLASR
ncbi:hypothetical protein HZU77_011495 [Neisseriaceae bacterium TC5R-5]|nr:hypothetical protein [Neisseriaceae bacterium TC5R-5]